MLFKDAFNIWDTTAVLVIVTLVLWLYCHYKSNFSYWKIRGVQYETPLPFFGNFAKAVLIRETYFSVLEDLYKKFSGLRYFGIYRSTTPFLVLRDPDIVKDILINNAECFRDRCFPDAAQIDPLFETVFCVEGKLWETLRTELCTVFRKQKTPSIFEIAQKCAKRITGSLWDTDRSNDVEVRELFARYSTDIAGLYFLDLEINSVEDFTSQVRDYNYMGYSTSFKVKLIQICVFFFPKWWKLIRILQENRLQEFLVGFTKAVMQYREENLIVRDDLLQLFMKLKNNTLKRKYSYIGLKGNNTTSQYCSDSEANLDVSNTMIAAHILCFIVGGSEIISLYMSYCAYELAVNQNIQEALRNEIDTVLRQTGGKFTYETIGRFTYMDQVVNETLRKYNFWPAERMCTKRYVIPGSNMMLEKGDNIIIPTHSFCCDPKYFPNPEVFDPERFSYKNKPSITPYTFMPFGEGPRNCICVDYSKIQFKVGIATLLMHYKLNLCKKSTKQLQMEHTVFANVPSKGIWLQIQKR